MADESAQAPNEETKPAALRPRRPAPPSTPRRTSSISPIWSTSASGPACTSATPRVRGLHHLVYEVVDNSIDEAMAGYAKHSLASRSTPTARSPSRTTAAAFPSSATRSSPKKLGRDVSTLEGVMTVLKFGGKFDKGRLPDLRRSARRRRHGRQLPLRMVRGRSLPRRRTSTSRSTSAACPPAKSAASARPTRRGTKTTFKPDPADLPDHQVRLRHAASSGCRSWPSSTAACDHRSPTSAPAKAKRSTTSDGIVEFVEHLNRASEPVHADVIYVDGEDEGVERRGRPAVLGRVHRERPLLRQQHQHDRRRHAPLRLPHRAHAHAQQLRQEGGHLQGPRPHRRRLPRRPHRRHQLPRARSRSSKARPRPSSATAKSKASSTRPSASTSPSTSKRIPRPPRRSCKKGMLAAEAREAARKAKRARPRAQGRPRRRRPARQAPRLHQQGRRQVRAVPGRR